MSNSQEETKGPGVLITFEGGEGAGKTTHITFLASCLRAMGREVLCLREPGGTSIGEAVRSLVLDPNNANMSDQTELLLYEAARAQIVREVLIPALARGAVVLLDRRLLPIRFMAVACLRASCVRQMDLLAKESILVALFCLPPTLLPKKGCGVLRTMGMLTG